MQPLFPLRIGPDLRAVQPCSAVWVLYSTASWPAEGVSLPRVDFPQVSQLPGCSKKNLYETMEGISGPYSCGVVSPFCGYGEDGRKDRRQQHHRAASET